jgi:hypothetical protein
MALPIKPVVCLHDLLFGTLSEWKKDPTIKKIELAYGYTPAPWARLRAGVREAYFPIPPTPSPYHGWKEWFQDYLEHQVAVVAEELKVEIVCLTNKGNHVKLNRKLVEDYHD